MEKELKDEIIQAVNDYMAANEMKPAEFARKAKVNESYFNYAYRGKYTYQTTELSDSFFRELAVACEYKLDDIYWSHINTDQYMTIIAKADEAFKYKYINTIIGSTGLGKSYAVERYRSKRPSQTIVVTVNITDNIYSIIEDIATKFKIKYKTKKISLRKLADAIISKMNKNSKYLIIIDEVENTKAAGIKAFKALYDLLVKPGHCGMVLAGTPEFLANLERFRRYGQEGMEQFYRRIIAGITYLDPIEKGGDFDKFMTSAGITERSFKELLFRQCKNYGVLHDYLERAIRIADEEGIQLTEKLFREIYNIKTNTNETTTI